MTQTYQSNFISPLFLEQKPEPTWGPTGKEVYERTYQRTMADGSKETWDDTVRRVVKGNLALVPSDRIDPGEERELYDLLYNFRAIPAGRHLWMAGVEGRQFLFNCYVSGWGNRLSEHFTFTFNQLMEGGGVGSNYSHKYVNGKKYPIYNLVEVHIVCSPEHENYQQLLDQNLLSTKYTSEWNGAYEVDDSREGWTEALGDLIEKAGEYEPADADYDRNAGQYLPVIVFDVSNLRAAGKRIKTFGGTSAGPVPFAVMIKQIGHLLSEAWESEINGPLAMEMDHAIATCVVSGNVRRSARMSQMHWDDPWIDWFLSCKENGLSHWSTNISVEIDDEFTNYISEYRDDFSDDGSAFEQRVRKAHRVYKAIISGMHRNGEPGFWNSSLSNVGEPNQVIATNPCGEICLESWENCNLGHINLDAFVFPDGSVDYIGLSRAHELMARFLIRATFGDITDEKTADVVLRNRRIGVGHFGYAGFVAKQGIKYSESYKNNSVRAMLWEMSRVVEFAVERYAHQLRIPVPVKSRTVAPTGTIAKLPGRTEGIHPAFARYFIRRIRYSTIDPDQANKIQEFFDQGYNIVTDPNTPNTDVVEIPMVEVLVSELEAMGIDPEILETVDEISITDQLEVQRMYQELWADNAVSYTASFDPNVYGEAVLADIVKPFLGVLKGTTAFPERGFVLPPYERMGKAQFEALRGSQVGSSVDEDCATGACPVR